MADVVNVMEEKYGDGRREVGDDHQQRTARVDDGVDSFEGGVAYAVDDEDDDAGNDYWLVATGFLTPTTVVRGTIGGTHVEVKASPSYFDEESFTVSQHFAVSSDGTRVPYFQVAAKDLALELAG